MQERPPFTHEQNLDIEEAFELNKFAIKQKLEYFETSPSLESCTFCPTNIQNSNT